MAMFATTAVSANPRKPRLLTWRLVLVAILLVVGHEVSRRLIGLNFHTVIPGRIYRGAQPSPGVVATLARDYGVRTIVNLRGSCLGVDWYVGQTRMVQELGIAQEDISFSASRLPSAAELRRLLDVLEGTEYPIYVHCRRGADRTGLTATVALLIEPGIDLAEARRQLGLWYGHIALGKTGVIDRFFELYDAWLTSNGLGHDAATFRRWALDEYHGGWCSAAFEQVTPLAQDTRRGLPAGYSIRVRNTGTEAWRFRRGSRSGVHLAYQVWDGVLLLAEGRAGMFDREVAPGGSADLTLVVKPLPRAGRFRLLIDMVEEGHCWFHQAGSEPHEEELVIRE
jgi:hypothetical protein